MTPPHPEREADASVIEAAGKLTKAQREALATGFVVRDGSVVLQVWQPCGLRVSTATAGALRRGGLVERLSFGDLLTPLGLAVRAHLASQAGSE